MKTKKLSSLSILTLILIATTTSSCDKECMQVKGEGPIYTHSYPISDFAGVDCQLDARINIIQDSVYEINVTTYENYQPLINLYVNNGILIIDSHKSLDDDEITIDIHTPRLNSIDMGGSGNIHTIGHFVSTTMNIQLSGSGSIDFNGDVSTLRTNISGSGKITLIGGSANAKMNISGSGELHGYSMQCANNDATISGSGSMETHVTEYLKATISGSGSIYYLGNPAISTNVSGSGDIIHVH